MRVICAAKVTRQLLTANYIIGIRSFCCKYFNILLPPTVNRRTHFTPSFPSVFILTNDFIGGVYSRAHNYYRMRMSCGSNMGTVGRSTDAWWCRRWKLSTQLTRCIGESDVGEEVYRRAKKRWNKDGICRESVRRDESLI